MANLLLDFTLNDFYLIDAGYGKNALLFGYNAIDELFLKVNWSIQNADCRPGAKCRLGTKCSLQTDKKNFFYVRNLSTFDSSCCSPMRKPFIEYSWL